MCVPASLLRHNALTYLGYSDSDPDEQTLVTLHSALSHIAEWSAYKQHYSYLKDFVRSTGFFAARILQDLQGKLDTALVVCCPLGLEH